MRIMRPKGTGLFDEAWDKFRKDKKYKDALEVIDEIWFFYDVEKEDVPKWEHRLDIIKRLRRLRKNPNIRVRLLMTTACVEYGFCCTISMRSRQWLHLRIRTGCLIVSNRLLRITKRAIL